LRDFANDFRDELTLQPQLICYLRVHLSSLNRALSKFRLVHFNNASANIGGQGARLRSARGPMFCVIAERRSRWSKRSRRDPRNLRGCLCFSWHVLHHSLLDAFYAVSGFSIRREECGIANRTGSTKFHSTHNCSL